MAIDVAVTKSNFSTKQDLADLKVDVATVKADVAAVKADITMMKSTFATKLDLTAIETQVERVRADLYINITIQTKWLASMQFVTLGLMVTVGKMFF